MEKLALISIVSTNWNSCEDIIQLLSSIDKSDYPKSKLEVIVVDNASTDNSIQKIKSKFPKTKVIALKKNIGIPARNVGLKKALGEIIFSIDSDVTVEKNLFKKVTSKIQSNPEIGLLGVRVLKKGTDKIQPSCVDLNFYTGVIHPIKLLREFDNFTFIAGLLHVFPKIILKNVGYYEPDFFFYGDDLDFCLRIKSHGFKVIYYPEVSVHHGKSKNTSDIPHSIKYHYYYKALFRNIYRYGNILEKISCTLCQLLIIPLFVYLSERRNSFSSRWSGFWWNIKIIKKETKILTVLFLLGLLLRLLTINTRDFWFDEAFSYFVARLPIKELLKAVLTDNNPPLYYLLLHFVIKISTSEFTLRLPSMIFNLLSILFLYSLVNKLLNKKSATVVVGLYALSPLAVYISTEARLHSLATLLALAIISLFLTLTDDPSPKKIFYFILFSTLGIYTQYYIVLLFLPFTWIVLKKKVTLSLKTWLKISSLPFISLVPWLFLSIKTQHNGCSCPNTLISLPATLVSPAIGGVGEFSLRFFPLLPIFQISLFIFASSITLLYFLKGLRKNFKISSIYLIPLIAVSSLGLFLPVFSPKGFVTFAPLFFVIVALGTSTDSLSLPNKILFFLFAAVVLIQIINPIFSGTRLKPIHDITTKDQSISVAHTSLLSYYSLTYYSGAKQKQILLTPNPLSSETVNFIGGKKDEINIDSKYLWLVDSQIWVEKQDYNNVREKIFEQYSIIVDYQIDNIFVYYLIKK